MIKGEGIVGGGSLTTSRSNVIKEFEERNTLSDQRMISLESDLQEAPHPSPVFNTSKFKCIFIFFFIYPD